MLKAMVFFNFVHFKDKYVLFFSDPSKTSAGSTSDPSKTSEGSTTSDPSKTPKGSTTSNPSKAPEGSTASHPSKTPGGGTASHPSKTPEAISTSDPSKTQEGSTTSDSSKTSEGSTASHLSKTSGGSTASDPSKTPEAISTSGPIKTPERSTTLDPSKTSAGSTMSDPSKTPEAISTSDPSKTQEESTTSNPINKLFFFVGANFCGKSVVLELIRRCMTPEINVSLTSISDEKSIAYVFCKFEWCYRKIAFSGLIKEPDEEKFYKLLIHTQDCKTILHSEIFSTVDKNDVWKMIDESFQLLNDEDKNALESLFYEETNEFEKVQHVLRKMKYPSSKERMQVELTWDVLKRKYVATMPLRGIGTVQWTESGKIGKTYKKENYSKASEQAEIISTLLNHKSIDKEKEKTIFNYLTSPQEFEFKEMPSEDREKEKKGSNIYVTCKQGDPTPFPLLKTSIGIIEAKQVSLLLAHREFNTICLEEPDRGMHPQMIERLKEVLYQEAFSKTIIVVTHSPYFIDTITIRNTYSFFRKHLKPHVTGIQNVGTSNDLSKVSDLDVYRNLLFATKVLIVEGSTDREVVQMLFTQLRNLSIEERQTVMKSGFKKENIPEITNFQIITSGGCGNAEKLMSFCRFIHLPCLCLLDLDKFLKMDKSSTVVRIASNDEEIREKCVHLKFIGKTKSALRNMVHEIDELSSFLQSRNIFIWKHGELEDAILSSQHLNKDIAESLQLKDQLDNADTRNGILKKKLKGRLEHTERVNFSQNLLKVDEIKQFLKFLETCP